MSKAVLTQYFTGKYEKGGNEWIEKLTVGSSIIRLTLIVCMNCSLPIITSLCLQTSLGLHIPHTYARIFIGMKKCGGSGIWIRGGEEKKSRN